MMSTYTDSTIARMMRNEADMAYRRRVQTIFEWLEPDDDDRILDGGCGRGFYLNFIRQVCGAQLAGIELERDYLKIAQGVLRSYDHISLIQGSLYQLPFPDGYFDKAIISEVLEHLDDDVDGLRSLARLVRQGGLIAITVPNANYPFWWDPLNKTLETLFHIHIKKGMFAGIWANHVRLYTHDELRQTVVSAGLEIVVERSFTHHAFPFIHNIVYGFGKTALEAGVLPKGIAAAADRHEVSGERGGWLNPVHVGLRMFEWFDRRNVMNEPVGRATVNLCILARKP
jgi:2-polyprenyl-6-hydroxyphenyl methylase/3-demethylubiquinone-9 3-methyltransferase